MTTMVATSLRRALLTFSLAVACSANDGPPPSAAQGAAGSGGQGGAGGNAVAATGSAGSGAIGTTVTGVGGSGGIGPSGTGTAGGGTGRGRLAGGGGVTGGGGASAGAAGTAGTMSQSDAGASDSARDSSVDASNDAPPPNDFCPVIGDGGLARPPFAPPPTGCGTEMPGRRTAPTAPRQPVCPATRPIETAVARKCPAANPTANVPD